MDLVQVVLLALVQGLTEFLPISSSAHLILVPALLGWTDQGLAFDIAVHLGSLLAVITYFRHELWALGKAVVDPKLPEFRLAWGLVVATVPLGLAGLAFADVVSTTLRSPGVIAVSTAGFGVLLWVGDRRRGQRSEQTLRWRDVLAIGLGQALALIPGTSRSGATMTVALALGLGREAAGRYSFLLAVPAVAMTGVWQSVQFFNNPEPVPWLTLALATTLSAVTAFAAIALFLDLIGRVGMAVFAVYRLLLAGVILYVLL